MAFLPTPNRDVTIAKLDCTLLGTQSKNSRDMLVKVKDAMVASGAWTVARSCDGTSVANSDLWSDWSKLNAFATFGGVSWIILRNTANAVELMIYITVAATGLGWTEMITMYSASATFTGGTTATQPTATDEARVTDVVGGDWLGTTPNGNPQFRAFVWTSTDGALTRVAWWFAGKLVAWWQFDQLFDGVSGGWVPFMAFQWNGGNDYTAPSARMTINAFAFGGSKIVRTNTGNNEAPQSIFNHYAGYPFVNRFPTNEQSDQWMWDAPFGLMVDAGSDPRRGMEGWLDDQWWVGASDGTTGNTPVFTDGDTAASGAFIFVGQMMLAWDGTLNPPTGAVAASTDRPATSFFGRNVGGAECECGPDDCDEPTTTLLAMRNGAKELADRVEDASISDITWNGWINEGVEDLWKKIVTATGDAFYQTHDFTLTGGAGANTFDVTTIPDRNFRRLTLLKLNPGSQQRRRIKPFNFLEKDRATGGGLRFSPLWDDARRYRRKGNLIMVEPYEQAAGSYRLHYVPKALTAPLELTCDALPDVLDEWNEYPQVFAAMKALGKEESSPGYLPTRLAELRQDISTLKGEPDDDADTNVIADVEGGGGRGWDVE